MEAFDKTLDDLEDMPEYQVGSWRSPYVKIYSIGGRNRIAEISNYPRAYKDTSPHVYTEDIPFTVNEDDLNHEDEGEQFYMDSKEDLYRLGEKATHWTGDGLPGNFPLWVESDTLPFAPNIKDNVFSLVSVPGPVVQVMECGIKAGPVYVKLPEPALDALRALLPTGKITLTRKPADLDKQIIRIRYRRIF